jgi:hypothetical protein
MSRLRRSNHGRCTEAARTFFVKTQNAQVLSEALAVLTEDVDDSMFIRPSQFLRRSSASPQVIPASSLALTNAEDDACHFVQEQAKQLDKDWVVQHTQKLTTKFPLSKEPLVAAVCECEAQIVKRMFTLRKRCIRTEAELRYAIGDPLLDMLSSYWGYKVCPKDMSLCSVHRVCPYLVR